MLAGPSPSHGHAILLSPPPRDSSDAHKDPTGPCGPTPRGSAPTNYKTGQTVTLTWKETVYHPGCYLIDFSPANDQNWQPLLTLTHSASTTTPIPYSAQVTLPAGVTCTACTLRIRQIMLSAQTACPPSPILTGQTYYSCSDILISDTAQPADMAEAPAPDLAVANVDAGAGGGGGAVATGCNAVPAGAAAGPLSGLALLGLATLALRRRRPV